MARTKITLTNDARVPRVVAFANGVSWYAYLRESGGLYVQRFFGDTFGAETLVVATAAWVDIIHDPVASEAWIYFIHDGTVFRMRVTDDLETPSLQVFQRSTGWNVVVERAQAGEPSAARWSLTPAPPVKLARSESVTPSLPGEPSAASFSPRVFFPPNIALVLSGDPSLRLLVITQPAASSIERIRFVRVYRADPFQNGLQLHATLACPPSTFQLSLLVPANTGSTVAWAAVNVRDDGLVSGLSALVFEFPGFEWKLGDGIRGAPPGEPSAAKWTLTPAPPIKYAATPDPVSGLPSGEPSAASWAVNGVDILK